MVAELRQSQRDWLKARDAGLKIYLAASSAAEKEHRRLQFLIDVSRAEAETTRMQPHRVCNIPRLPVLTL